MRDPNFDRRGFLAAATTATILASASEAGAQRRRRGGGYDVVVVGAGVFGAWTAWQLQQKGARVLLTDAWGPAHSRASSGGETRLIRTEYRGDPIYTRWSKDSLVEWKLLAERTRLPLFRETGALYIFPEIDEKIEKSAVLHRQLGIPYEQISPADLARRWPQIDFTGIAIGVMQPTMGALMAYQSVQALTELFVARGGTYRQVEIVPPRIAGDRLGEVLTTKGERIAADKFVFACGPWLPKLFPEAVGARIVPSRQDVFFFAPEGGDTRFMSPAMPAWVDVSSPDLHYGFPDLESRGFKIALDKHGPAYDPDSIDRRVRDRAVADVRAYLRKRFPALANRPLAESRVCQYENSHNGNLLLDRHPSAANVWIAGGGSGHGFKHGPAVGRYVAGLLDGSSKVEQRFLFATHREHG
ncbi:FAD-dependent oxidoreductase [Sphingomonas sp. MG17]|uniref:FAD-dependent oxidoreductase n=1 Tax=Sphingomonas tagetis TaxID=2949092 RepID=A0A9X2HKU6_9SPHN|nr:FAD-dependent oxidoreductase [Sphingomonas tagetis]MCP3731024.1 FAD-dependent oxidoreductase [Sphingomonas tagetis]